MNSPLDHFRSLNGFRQTGENQYEARCPAHDDRIASLSICTGQDGRALVHCHAGCSTETVVTAMGITTKDLFPANSNGFGKRVVVAIYDYRDLDGTLLYQVVRFKSKKFQQRRPVGDGWDWSVKGIKRVPYRLPELKAADSIFITEGEKDADALQGIGLTATCNAGGAGKWPDELDQYFRPEQEVVIIPDNDEPGRKHAELVAGHLHPKVESVKILRLEGLPEKGDVSDWLQGRDPEGAAEELCKLAEGAPEWRPGKAEKPEKKGPFSLREFALNSEAEAMKKQMLEDKFVLGRIALLGQSTAIYAPPNAGKTLLTIRLLIDAIKHGDINGDDVFYINADDSHAGLVFKLDLANQHGFWMMAPGHKGFKAEHLPLHMQTLINDNAAKGKIIILDTVKKFTDLMKKDQVSAFGEAVRQFISHGGTVIMLAHTNKHRGQDNKLVYSGTSDLVDDCDCYYTIDILTEDPSAHIRTVTFENSKSRGDVALEVTYRYNYDNGISYLARLESIEEVTPDDRKAAEQERTLAKKLDKNRRIIEAIKESIRDGIAQQTKLIKEVMERTGESRRRTIEVLNDFTGPDVTKNQFWQVNVSERNAHVYQLNYSTFH